MLSSPFINIILSKILHVFYLVYLFDVSHNLNVGCFDWYHKLPLTDSEVDFLIRMLDERTKMWKTVSSTILSPRGGVTAIGKLFFFVCGCWFISLNQVKIACGDHILICSGGDENGNNLNTTEWFDGAISNGPTMLCRHFSPSFAFINGRQC